MLAPPPKENAAAGAGAPKAPNDGAAAVAGAAAPPKLNATLAGAGAVAGAGPVPPKENPPPRAAKGAGVAGVPNENPAGAAAGVLPKEGGPGAGVDGVTPKLNAMVRRVIYFRTRE